MSGKTCAVVVWLFITQLICLIYSKSLPTSGNDAKAQGNSSTSSYYRHNIFGPNTYAFGFEVNDKVSGNLQFRDERRYANGTTQGSYGYLRPDGSVMVTHFLADSERGFLSQSQNFLLGEEAKWQENWPTNKPNVSIVEKPLEPAQPEIVYDEEEKLNLTSILLPVKDIKQNQGIDLNPTQLEKELVNPAVLEVINGNVPLIADSKRKENSIGFETINKFIPTEFPIVPFELPHEDTKINLNEGLGAKPIPVLKKTNDSFPSTNDTSIESTKNNTDQLLPIAVVKASDHNGINLNTSTRVETISSNQNSEWYDKIIKQTRQEYLETVQQ